MNRTESRSPVTLPPVTLTPEEAAAVAVALAAQPEGPYADAGRGALEKVLGALEPDPGRRSQLLATSLWVSAEAGHSAEIRSVLDQAVSQRRVLALRYRDGEGKLSRREVEPQLVVRSSDQVFLVAWCCLTIGAALVPGGPHRGGRATGETAPRRDLAGLGAPPLTGHPAGRALKRDRTPSTPRLVVLPGGRA